MFVITKALSKNSVTFIGIGEEMVVREARELGME